MHIKTTFWVKLPMKEVVDAILDYFAYNIMDNYPIDEHSHCVVTTHVFYRTRGYIPFVFIVHEGKENTTVHISICSFKRDEFVHPLHFLKNHTGLSTFWSDGGASHSYLKPFMEAISEFVDMEKIQKDTPI